MAEKAISQRKRLAMGEVPHKYAKGGMVMPKVGPQGISGDGIPAKGSDKDITGKKPYPDQDPRMPRDTKVEKGNGLKKGGKVKR